MEWSALGVRGAIRSVLAARAIRVHPSMTPVRGRPTYFWNATTACLVESPNVPNRSPIQKPLCTSRIWKRRDLLAAGPLAERRP